MDAFVQFFHAIPLDLIIIQTVNGIVTGMILALIASGLTLIFGIMDVVNFAHGALFMLGAYVGVVIIATTGSFWLALIGSSLIVALLGAAMQIVALRPLIGRDPLNTSYFICNIPGTAFSSRCCPRRSSAGSGFISNAENSASGSEPPRRIASWRRPWGFRCRGSIPAYSLSARRWRRPAVW